MTVTVAQCQYRPLLQNKGHAIRQVLACCVVAALVALLMRGEWTVAKPEASKASDLACTSCRLGRSHPLVATDCRQAKGYAMSGSGVGVCVWGPSKEAGGGGGVLIPQV